MNNSFFNNDFDALFNSMFNEMNANNNYTKKRYYINGHEVTPEQLAALKQQGYQFKEDQQQLPAQSQGKALSADGILGKLGRNLTEEARQGQLDPVIGRDKEIQDTAEVLSRRIKNNPILVGEAGVGKTAIVEGLAQEIVKGNVPASIKDKEIYSLDISALEAGTQYRGAFEENVQKLLDEVKSHGNIVLFLDEIHQIIGAGSTGGDSGSKGLSDIIKPALSRGEISVIGATTQDEYRNTILKDAALSRRFNEVVVNEPSKEDAFEILKGIRDNYEKHHNVEIPDEALKAAIDLSIQYIPQRTLPDKAIDLMDISAAHVSAAHTAVDKVEAEKEIAALTEEKEKAVQNEEYEKASNIQAQIKELNDKVSAAHDDNKNTVTVDEVAATVERLTGIPVSKMDSDDLERLKNIQSRLEEKIIGQADAVKAVSRAIRRNRAGFDEGNRPIGSFLFVGPTGVGKTELAKQLAVDLFGNKDSLIRLDMSEYMDQTAVSKMIGTTAGYVGYDDNSNTLTEQVRRNPYSVILFDEIEKANPQILTLLLQVLDDGKLTDGQGNIVNFKNTIIIATSNAGFGDGQEADKDSIFDDLKHYFRPEFLNRFNAIVEFKHLSKEDLQQIVELMLADVQRTLDKKEITMNITDEAKNWLIEQGYDEKLGARPLRRVVEQNVRDMITDYYLDNPEVKEVNINVKDDQLTINE
ncbi:ATP-dependent Clp protease ATP-binding subunit [Macrococcus hajekii]|uniref:ATP-dependent Clp protease ATP-binding subunit ClpC n=1 Tax=Macrococcus hajekii TaxID=198482 RepID=A0A4R6BJ70_9STAP|nr:ATP-dependent Clp protease ATP-binding subunit [Macrococcus hajekii]TDM01743.1 ATP-dependent Clp protease ATP-binding subunit [Macrococcus hajekii]GGB07050.1 ATP-dependent Clp protease ATP-binding subunit ClpL [Macrococcus hajekii]